MSDTPIVLTLTIYPPKKQQRKIVVTGAPEGEMPLLLEGVFAERHTLLDQAFTAVLKREPQVVTTKEDKRKQKSGVQFGAGGRVGDTGAFEDESPADAGETAAPTGSEATGKFSTPGEPADDLPAIEGDPMAGADDPADDQPADDSTGDESNEE
jgi:hypothetical protein